MHLKKLEIFGFKSFAQKTSINFNTGVTSIVGPNGCGKTNIVDAIRWCLGEQKSGALRSDKMENVIFNGTSSKKPMGMAEVSLTIENNKGTLPTEYSEVTITRRIFRSGESEYLLNKNICRLKDITNLFMDTGIGVNAYSVIELKMIETILNNKADERRNMFEEAAGVNKYKLRRRLAFRKLEDVKTDLSRVNDIISEVEKKVNSLGRQAKKAEKHTNISSTLRELEIDFAERQLALFSKQEKEITIKKETNFKRKLEIESDISRVSDELKSVKESLEEIEGTLESKRKEISTVTEKIFFSQKQLSVAEERSNLLSDNIDKYHQDLEDLNQQIKNNQVFIEENENKIKEFSDLIYQKENEKNEATNDVENLSLILSDKGRELKEKSESLLSLYKKINVKENDFSNVGKSLEAKNSLINSSNERIQNLTNIIAKTVGFIEQLQTEKIAAQKNLEESESEYVKEQEKKERLEAQLNTLKNDELERKSLINSMKDKISFMQSLIDNLDGVSKGTKALINNGEWTKRDKNLLAQIGNSEEKYRLAVEASLRNNLNNILIDSIEELKNAIDYLKNNSAGRAAFYVSRLTDGKNDDFWVKLNNFASKRRVKKLQKTPGFIGWSKDYIKSDKKWNLLFQRILFNTAIVDSIDTMLNISADFKEFNFVTLDGDFLDTSGLVESGSAIKVDDSLFGRMQLLEDLRKNFPEEEKKLNELSIEIEKIEEELNEIDLKRYSDKARLLVNDLANVDKQISQFEYEKNKSGDEIESFRNDIQNLAQESNNLDQNKIDLEAELKNYNDEKEEQEKLKDDLESRYKELEKNYNDSVENKNKTNIEYERLISERKNIENAINRAKSALETIDTSIIKRENDISQSNNEKSLLYHKIENSRKESEENENRKTRLLEEEAEIYERFKLIQSNIKEQEESQNSLRKEREILTDEIHKLDLQLNELRIRINNLIAGIKENYSISLNKKEFEDLETFDFKEREQKVYELKQRIKSLGPINLLAYSEYEEEKERFDFMSNQRNDLINSEKDLLKSIEEINVIAQSLFIETFEKIRINFVSVFGSLFNPGDEADLKLEENIDPLEAKIEIIAKPKGKRPTSIELLSGGEKTLTAIALLFSIYLVKPSPFCILDEIDAPLDDANIDRFNKIITDFSESTQFIVVTHNKRTMEAANTLYGVTMQDQGISKLVSVRFNEDFDFVAS